MNKPVEVELDVVNFLLCVESFPQIMGNIALNLIQSQERYSRRKCVGEEPNYSCAKDDFVTA